MGEVVESGIPTTLDLPPDRILDAAKGKLDSVLVLGITTDEEEYFASSSADAPSMLWLIERVKKTILEIA
jgi:hypothetical protein